MMNERDPPAYELININGRAPVLIICDHASNVIPAGLSGLGLDPSARADHIAWDIGAAAVARLLSRRLDAPLVLAGVSRLVIDCNRRLDDSTAIPAVSDGIPIPGNRGLTPEQAQARAGAWYWPYHRRIAAILSGLAAPALVAIHSFTPVMGGIARPWQIGILWDRDPRIAVPLMAALRRRPDLVIGDNQPYSARAPEGYSIASHAEAAGLPHVSVEIRQDLIADAVGAARWEQILGEALALVLASLHQGDAAGAAGGDPGIGA